MFNSRLRLHLSLAAGTVLILFAAREVGDPGGVVNRVSTVSAYLFLVLLSVVMVIGPLRAMRTGRALINHTGRRDVAIWCAFIGLVHLFAGIAQSMTPAYLEVFVTGAAQPLSAILRDKLFFWSTIAGFVVGVLLIVLLALSSNWSLAVIGQRWWKRLHQLSYIVFVLTLVHGFGFQLLESRSWVGYVLVIAMMFVVCIAQVQGVRAVRRRSR